MTKKISIFNAFQIFSYSKVFKTRNGSKNYISNINKKISMSKAKKVNIIDCYNIEEKDIDVERIKKQYDDILNTKKYKKFNKGIDKN